LFEIRVLRRIFGHKRKEIMGSGEDYIWRSLNDLYSSPYIIRVIKLNEMGVTCSTYGEKRGVYRVMVAKLDGKRPLERRRLMLQ
jgi:hypothetical protein